jgi:hypothetical protein
MDGKEFASRGQRVKALSPPSGGNPGVQAYYYTGLGYDLTAWGGFQLLNP